MRFRPFLFGSVSLMLTGFLAFALARVPPHGTIDAMAIVDLDAVPKSEVRLTAYDPSRLRWTMGRGLGLAFHVVGAGAWSAQPMALAGPGIDLPLFALRSADVVPVAKTRIHAPLEETIWLSGGGRAQSGLAIAPDGLVRFFYEDSTRRLGKSLPLALCVRPPAP